MMTVLMPLVRPVNFSISLFHEPRSGLGARTSVALEHWSLPATRAATAASFPSTVSAMVVAVLPPPITSARTPPRSARVDVASASSVKPMPLTIGCSLHSFSVKSTPPASIATIRPSARCWRG